MTVWCLYLYLLTLLSYYSSDSKSAFHSLAYLDQQLNIISEVVGGLVFNGLFIGIFLKIDFRKPNEQKDLDYLLLRELVTESEYEEMEKKEKKYLVY